LGGYEPVKPPSKYAHACVSQGG